MAKIWFRTDDGQERAYRLDKNHPIRIGRDPGNDIVLRDPRVSRQHAQIVFEKGFFVLHDLSSANGSWVNGRRVRIAPLIEGSQVRIGNSLGRFSEELATGLQKQAGTGMAAGDTLQAGASPFPLETVPHERAAPPEESEEPDPSREQAPPAPNTEDEIAETSPLKKESPDSLVEQQSNVSAAVENAGSETDEPEESGTRNPGPASPGAEGEEAQRRESLDENPSAVDSAAGAFSFSRYLIDVGRPDSDNATIRDPDEHPLFYFRKPVQLVGLLAGLVGGFILVAGLAATTILAMEIRLMPAAAALVLTVAFAGIILSLVPRRSLTLFEDELMRSPGLIVDQESRTGFPSLRFGVREPDGTAIGALQRNAFGRLGRHRWWLLDHGLSRLGYAIEGSFPRALLRNFGGSFFGILLNDFRIVLGGEPVGALLRKTDRSDRSLLDLGPGALALDRRLALALVVVIETVEPR